MRLPLFRALAVLVCLAGPVRARDADGSSRSQARALLEEGARLFDEGDYDGALAKFKAAHATLPSPKLYFNMGQAYRSLVRDVEAIEAFELFLAGAQDAPPTRRREAEEAIAALDKRIGQIRLLCDTDDATISVDGTSFGRTPRAAPLRLGAGPHQLVVERAGRPPFLERLELRPGATVTVRVVLAQLRPEGSRRSDAAAVVSASGDRPQRLDQRSHAGRVGAFFRADFAASPESGQRLLPGLSYGLTDRLELEAAAVIGSASKGAWVGVRLAFRSGAWRPGVVLGAPLLFAGGKTLAGVQAALGISVDLGAHAGLFADVGGALFPGADAERRSLWLLVSAGARVRL